MRTINLFIIAVSLFASLDGYSYANGDSIPAAQGTPLFAKTRETNALGLKTLASPNESKYKRWTNLKYSGYIRSFVQYRNMPERYAEVAAQKQLAFNGWEIAGSPPVPNGYQEPLLLLRVEGNPTARTFFKLEYAFDNQLTGIVKDNGGVVSGNGTYYNRRVSAYRVLQFEAQTSTGIGDFKLISGGGVIWYKMSPFTFWNYEYRDDMFERYPWEPEGISYGRYNQFYATQNVARDSRWGNTATQGFILEAKNLPLGFGVNLIYGKTDNSGGFQSFVARTPRNMAAYRVEKIFGQHKFGVNYFSQFGYTDASALFKVKQQIYTLDGRINFENYKFYFEGGMGMFQDFIVQRPGLYNIAGEVTADPKLDNTTRFYNKGDIAGINNEWQPGGMLEMDIAKSAFNVPFKVQVYSISKSIVNVNSQILNSANEHAVATPTNIGAIYNSTVYPSVVTDLFQMTNNRSAVNIKHEESYGLLKVMIGAGAGQELENLSNVVGFQHRANQFTRSRFSFFTRGNGPYGRIQSVFRRTFEFIPITDDPTTINYRKGFNTLDLSLKYKLSIFKKDLILSNYNNYNSISDGFKIIPSFNNKAFVRTFYEELMAFYSIHPRITVIGFACLERVVGNNRTAVARTQDSEEIVGTDIIKHRKGDETTLQIDPTAKPVNQFGKGFGLGIDYDFTGKAGLYIRHRWFEHKDTVFTRDLFKGQETAVELKIFF